MKQSANRYARTNVNLKLLRTPTMRPKAGSPRIPSDVRRAMPSFPLTRSNHWRAAAKNGSSGDLPGREGIASEAMTAGRPIPRLAIPVVQRLAEGIVA